MGPMKAAERAAERAALSEVYLALSKAETRAVCSVQPTDARKAASMVALKAPMSVRPTAVHLADSKALKRDETKVAMMAV